MQLTKEALERKGWTAQEIAKTLSIVDAIEQANHAHNKKHHHLLYLLIVVSMAVGNFFAAVLLIPVMSTASTLVSLAAAALLGIVLGFLFATVILDLEKLEPVHHYSAILLIAIACFFNTISIAAFAKTLFVYPGFHAAINPVLIGIIYAVACTIPYALLLRKARA